MRRNKLQTLLLTYITYHTPQPTHTFQIPPTPTNPLHTTTALPSHPPARTTPIPPPPYPKYELTPLPDALLPTTIFVGNLDPLHTTEHDLSTAFHGIGKSQSVPAVLARKASGGSLGYGFVSFLGEREAELAVETMDGVELAGKRMVVEKVREGQNVPSVLVRYTMGEEKGGRRRKGRGRRGGGAERSRNRGARRDSVDEGEMERAWKRGYLTLHGTAFRRGRRSSAIACVHREGCDARTVPQIVLCKASGGRLLDHLIVDLSTLRCGGGDGVDASDGVLGVRRGEILEAARVAGMVLVEEHEEDHTVRLGEDGGGCGLEDWTELPIGDIPAIGLGVFEGQRSSAKEMAKMLATLWGTVDDKAGSGREVVMRRRRRMDRKGGSSSSSSEYKTGLKSGDRKRRERRRFRK